MAVKTSWSSGDVLTAADLTDTFAAKGDVAGETWTGTHDFSGATVSGIGAGLTLITPTSIAYSGTSATSSGGTTTVTACTSVSLNGVFSADYENYLVVARMTATDYVLCRMRASGSDASSGYVTQQIFSYSSTVGANSPYTNGFGFMYVAVAEPSVAQHVISGPYLAAHTRDSGQASTADSTSVTALRVLGGALRNTTQYDGMSLVALSGSMTGTVRVYGYEGA